MNWFEEAGCSGRGRMRMKVKGLLPGVKQTKISTFSHQSHFLPSLFYVAMNAKICTSPLRWFFLRRPTGMLIDPAFINRNAA